VPDTDTSPQGRGKTIMTYCRPDGDCEMCSAWNYLTEQCSQDEDQNCTSHEDESCSDADSGL